MTGKFTLVMRRLAILGVVGCIFIAGCGNTSQPFSNTSQSVNNQPPPPPGGMSSEPGPISMAVAPEPSGKFGKFAYVANYNSNKIAMYTINAATGALTSIGTIAAGSFPSSIAIDPSGRFAYVTNAGDHYHAGDVSMYTIDATTGALTSAGTVAAGISPGSVAVHPSGKFAYVGNLGDFVGEGCSLSMYTINATSGVLTPTGTIESCFPVSMVVNPFGKFAYVASPGDSSGPGPDCCGFVFMYTIDAATGALTSIGGIAAGSSSSSIAVDPSGKFAYVANSGSNDVSMYTINAATGALTSIGTVATAGHAASVAVDPSGRFAYLANCLVMSDLDCWSEGAGSAGSVSMYTIDAATGALTSIGTIAAGSFSSSIAIDPSGKFSYVTNFHSNSISMYSIDPASGALTLIGTIGT
jgi:YVTN family beta-propeller protein